MGRPSLSTLDAPPSTCFTWPIRVYWEDTDAGGVVYYANYLKFLERARSEWLRALGIHQADLAAQENVLFVVRRVEADYLRPARFDDELCVHCHIAELGRASLTMAQRIVRGECRGEEALLAAQVKIACVSADALKPRKIPNWIMEKWV